MKQNHFSKLIVLISLTAFVGIMAIGATLHNPDPSNGTTYPPEDDYQEYEGGGVSIAQQTNPGGNPIQGTIPREILMVLIPKKRAAVNMALTLDHFNVDDKFGLNIYYNNDGTSIITLSYDNVLVQLEDTDLALFSQQLTAFRKAALAHQDLVYWASVQEIMQDALVVHPAGSDCYGDIFNLVDAFLGLLTRNRVLAVDRGEMNSYGYYQQLMDSMNDFKQAHADASCLPNNNNY